MIRVPIDTAQITDWPSFHAVFAEAMGFPDFYGQNLNAWIDCMSDLTTETDVGMTRVVVPFGTPLALELVDAQDFRARAPEQFAGLLESVAFLNAEVAEAEVATRIVLLPR